MNVTSVKQVVGIYATGLAAAATVALGGVPAVANAVAPEPTVVQQVQEDDPAWDWRSDGNHCRGLYGNGVLECTQYPTDPNILNRPGHWNHIRETGNWMFCPTGRSDIECGA